MKEVLTVKSPSRRELITLRLMIFLGLIAMGFFLYRMLSPATRGNETLYYLLLTTFVFGCLRILHEWVHYFFITVPETPPQTKTYTVDIFTTFCKGEPYQMIEETLAAIQKITYPHKAYLCDESDDPYLKELCSQLGVFHVTRIEKINAKAGNINNALRQSDGELCVVLDPDHVPFPEFLDPIVSHFDNPEIGFVQIVQAYKNAHESIISNGAAQQTYQFYGPMMMTMNRYGTVQAIGANCTFRRTALDSIGGHAAGLAEDMHTSMRLHAKGWKSIYVPAVLARGLVPSTLSAYYQQQLKWSRGVFELLVTAYPELFRKFTWKQKLHYGLLPLHYASGFIALIDFLVPLVALFFNISPMNIRLSEFGLTLLPMASAILLIRHFVQWWVMEDTERGFHMHGGLLMIGTWWIFITGMVYTVLRKKVPYLPTPKDGYEDDNWVLNIPNLIVLALSLAAIVFGLSNDWNPYNIAMAGFAATNCSFMVFVIYASRQQHFKRWSLRSQTLYNTINTITLAKKRFWYFRRRVYKVLRSTALSISIILLSILIYLNAANLGSDAQSSLPVKHARSIESAIELSERTNFYSAFEVAEKNRNISQKQSPIVSMEISWGNKEGLNDAFEAFDLIYAGNFTPMLTWNDIAVQSTKKDDFDPYLSEVARKIKILKRPVFLRVGNGSAETAATWRYVCDYLKTQRVSNVIMVWNLSKAPRVFFPGKNYVDWLSIKPGEHIPSNPLLADLPVLIVYPLESIGKDQVWAKNNVADHLPDQLLTLGLDTIPNASSVTKITFPDLRGINYSKAYDWTKVLNVLTKRDLQKDFAEIKSLHFNTIKFFDPGIYRHNILEVAGENQLNVHYGFWIPDDIDFVNEKDKLQNLTGEILTVMEGLTGNDRIKSWNLGNTVLQKLETRFHKPDLFYQQEAYLLWLKDLVQRMKKIDAKRSITLDINATADSDILAERLHAVAPGIDAFGLVLADAPKLKKNWKLKFPHFISYTPVSNYAHLKKGTPVFISNWQDSEWTDKATFDGLKDFEGRNKLGLLYLSSLWNKKPAPQLPPEIKILKPATGTFPGISLEYHAIIRKDNQWVKMDQNGGGLSFEWKLVKTDFYEHPVTVTSLATGPSLSLQIPSNQDAYRLYLYVLRDNSVIDIVQSRLNTPLPINWKN